MRYTGCVKNNTPLAKQRYFDNRLNFFHKICQSIEEIIWHASPNFITKYSCVQELWSFYEKSQNFKLTKLEKSYSSHKRWNQLKRLMRIKMLLVQKTERVFLMDETIFYLNPPINNQNNHIWSGDTKHGAKNYVIVSAWTCYCDKGRLYVVADSKC